MARRPYNKHPGHIIVGRCFCCASVLHGDSRVYFGPLAFMKCSTCGPWGRAQLAAASAIADDVVRRGATTALTVITGVANA